jgi:catechol 2,3-dioxygenase
MPMNRRTVLAAGATILGGATAARSEREMSELPFAATTPTHIGRIGVVAKDARNVANFYKDVIGLRELRHAGGVITLGVGDRPLMEIEQSAAIRPDDPRAAGLYHTAFLMPSRAELGRWIRHAVQNRVQLTGAADHLVSEALYLNDPEGNGIEIYADRDRKNWSMDGDRVKMANSALDGDGIVASSQGLPDWTGAPDNALIGHVHLRVGDANKAREFWNDQLGFDTMLEYGPQAVFLSSGGYHHHIGANSWQSRGAGPRDKDRTGLQWVELLQKGPATPKTITDPWGTEIRVAPAA